MCAQAGIRSSSTTSRFSRLAGRAGIGLVLAGVVLGVSAGAASAAPDGDTQANAVVTSGITLTALTPSFSLTGTPGATVQSGAVTYNVETNNAAGYTVTVVSASSTLFPAVANGDTIPIGDLTVRETGTTPYAAMSDTGAVTVHSQDDRSGNTGDNLSTEYQMRIPTVAPATYSAELTYLATSQ